MTKEYTPPSGRDWDEYLLELGIVVVEEPLPFGPASVNFYLLGGPPAVLIDAGMQTPAAMGLLEAATGALGLKVSDIEHVFLTHAHVDHAGLASRLAEQYGARVWIHPEEAIRVNGGQAQFMSRGLPVVLKRLGAAPDMVDTFMGGLAPAISNYKNQVMDGYERLENGMRLPVDGLDLEVIHTPGHSYGSVCFFEKKHGLLFSGDTLLPLGPPQTVLSPTTPDRIPWNGFTQLERSLDILAETRASTVLAGHGRASSFDDLIALAQKGLADRRRNVREALEFRSTPFSMVRRTSGNPAVTVLRMMQLAEVRSTLETLVGEGTVRMELVDGVEYFYPV